MGAAQKQRAIFHIGDQAKFQFGGRKVVGTIVEDRGAIGVHGRRLYTIQIYTDPQEPMHLVLAEEELELAEQLDIPRELDKSKVIQYLTHGGLIAILRSNYSGGKTAPRVWLCLDNLENVTHTFIPERGIIGGDVPPFFSLQNGRIFEPKRDEVVEFLTKSFKLTKQEAEKIVAEVGTAGPH